MSRKRTYDQTFRMEAVSLVNTSNKSIAAVARELDIPPQTLTRWVSMYGNEGSDAFVGSGNLSSEKQEERDLQKQIRDLEEENRILKKLCASLPTTRSDFWFHPGTPTRIPCIKDV